MTWAGIVEEHGETLFRIAFRVLHNAHDAEDVTQDVLLEAHCMDRSPNPGLLRRMVVLRAIDRLRRRAPRGDLRVDPMDPHQRSPMQREEDRELADSLRAAIGRLPQRQAQCFWFRHVEGLSNIEIAEATQLSVSAVSTAIHRAKKNLQEALPMIQGEARSW